MHSVTVLYVDVNKVFFFFRKKTGKGNFSELGKSEKVGLYMSEIEQKMKKEKGFRGVFMSDTLPKNINRFENGIINLDTSDGDATHWVCYYNTPKSKYIEYFDPFGEYKYDDIQLGDSIIPEIIKRYLDTSGKKIKYNSSFLQHPLSVKCGYFCMKYIIERNKGNSMYDVLYSFTQEPSKKNEKLVLNL